MKTQFVIMRNNNLFPLTKDELYSEEVFNFQGTEEWHLFRGCKEGGRSLWPAGAFGASSAAALVDAGYNGKDFIALALEMSGYKKPPKVGGIAVERGNDNEDSAREAAEFVLGKYFSPVCAFDEDRPYHRVSYDGVAFDKNGVPVDHLEIKVPMVDKFIELSEKLGEVANCPEDLGSYSYYYPQVQLQLSLLPSHITGNLFIYSPERNEYLLVKVPRNDKYIKLLLEKLDKLFHEVHRLAEGNVSEELSIVLDELLFVKKRKDSAYKEHSALDKEYKHILKEVLSDAFDNESILSNGRLSVSAKAPNPSIDYKALVEEFLGERIAKGEIDLSKFLKQGATRYTVFELVV